MGTYSNVHMDIRGADELAAMLEDLGGMTKARHNYAIIREGLLAGGEVLKKEAVDRVQKRTGHLASRIGVSRVASWRNGMYVKVGVEVGTMSTGRGYGAAYGIPLEWGHVNRDGSFTPPYPFMSVAYRDKKQEAYQAIKMHVRQTIESITR